MRSQHEEGWIILTRTISIICQTLFYGTYVSLIPFSTHILLKKKTMTRGNKIMFSVTIFMFSLSTAYWISSVGSLISTIVDIYSPSPERFTTWASIFTMVNAILLINYILTDGIVVWRAWVLCRDRGRKILLVLLFFLVCTSLSVATTIGIRIALVTNRVTRDLNGMIDAAQITNLVLSLLTNIGATSTIAFRAWQHHRENRATVPGHKARTKVERVLVLLVESGFVYCVSGLLVLLASVSRLPFGTLGDIYVPIHVQIAGIYPTVILVLVGQKRSLKEGAFSTVGSATANAPSQVEAMDFRSNPAVGRSSIFHDESLRLDNEYHDASSSQVEASVDHPEARKCA